MSKTPRGMIIACILAAAVLLPADEGMWLPHQMKDLQLKSQGLRMDPDDLYKTDGTGLMSAVVNLGGGTGEFVSAEGLILTNHHVAFGAIQRAASKEKDYIREGFLARGRQEEIPAKGYTADVLLGYEDVTAGVTAKLKPGMTHRQRYDAVEKAVKELIVRAERGGADLRASVSAMYSGNRFFLFKFKRIRDVRLVYAPPQDLGNFGGDVDNWMWPRHTCDFSFLRAYVSKDNVGVEFNERNVPYRPKSVLKISLDGFKPGDFTFVMGYPGRTYRNFAPSELRFEMEQMAGRIKEMQRNIAFFESAGKDDKEIEIRYAGRVKGLYNRVKNLQGKLEGMEKISLSERKEGQERSFLEWVNLSPDRRKQYGGVLDDLSRFMAKYKAFISRNEALASAAGASTLLSQAYTLLRTAEERQKPDKDREPGYQDRNLPYIKMSVQLAERGYDFETDKAYLKFRLKNLLEEHPGKMPAALSAVVRPGNEKGIDAFVDDLYARTILAGPEKRLELLDMKPADLARLRDPLIALAAGLEKELKVIREEGKAVEQERSDLKKAFEAALLEMKEGHLASDANGTIRFTYGPIEGYSPKDAVFFLPQTTLKGVIDKDSGRFPFAVPAKLKDLYRARDFGGYADKELNDVPVCFLNTTNVTGGNSGSPVLNAGGEQIGIIFDMTYESVIGDYYVVPEMQRSISVDLRYVLFVTEKFSGAAHIIKELGF